MDKMYSCTIIMTPSLVIAAVCSLSESDYLYVYYYEYINYFSVEFGLFFRQFATSAHVKIVNGYPATASSDIRQIE